MSIEGLALVIIAAASILYHIMINIPREQRKRFDTKLGSRYEVKKIIDNLRVDTCIEQVLIWESFNGNGIAKFGAPLKISVIEESMEKPFRSVAEDFSEFKIYGQAIEIMMQMQEKGSTAAMVHEMEDGVFKRAFSELGALWVEWFAIGPSSEKTFFFATIATSSPESPYQLNQGGRVDIAKNALRNKYRKMNRSAFDWIKKAIYP